MLGHLASISADMQFEVFAINCSTASLTLEYVTDLQLDQDNPIGLRPPCPSCAPTYNQLTLASTPHQTFIPVAERLIVTTIIHDQPYAQLVRMDGCEPTSMLKPKNNRDLLYVQCRNSGNARTLYQLARLLQNPEDLGELQWTFQFYDDFDDFTSEGEYYEYYDTDLDRYEVMFMYSKSGKLFFEGPDNGYYRFYALPDDCATTVRLTPITDANHQIIIECSDSSHSDTISGVYAFDPDTGDIASILSNVEYSKCPIRFSKDGSIIAIFTKREVLVTNLTTTDSVLARVPVQGSGVVYDGLLTTVEGVTYAIYSTREGLFTFNVSQTLQGGSATGLMDQTDDICAEEGCPLLVLADDNRVLATLDNEIAMYSINPPRLVNRVATTYQPARLSYQECSAPQFSPLPPESSPSLTPVATQSANENTETSSQPNVVPADPNNEIVVKHDGSVRVIAGSVIGSVAAIVCLAATCVAVWYCGKKKNTYQTMR